VGIGSLPGSHSGRFEANVPITPKGDCKWDQEWIGRTTAETESTSGLSVNGQRLAATPVNSEMYVLWARIYFYLDLLATTKLPAGGSIDEYLICTTPIDPCIAYAINLNLGTVHM
jgi:hypothetical protein